MPDIEGIRMTHERATPHDADSFDLVVIGSGPAGEKGAIQVAPRSRSPECP